ncbi:MAG: hypothetical protein JO352_15210 [Chloroflexi bacterium]|nr:hypothetical protein [Chloroflexota bacterium]
MLPPDTGWLVAAGAGSGVTLTLAGVLPELGALVEVVLAGEGAGALHAASSGTPEAAKSTPSSALRVILLVSMLARVTRVSDMWCALPAFIRVVG